MTTRRKKLSIITLGCQMNSHDSEWISGALANEYDYTTDRSQADLLVVNTCAVREKAEEKFFSLLGRLRPLKAAKKGMVALVAGCVAQELADKIMKREPFVDIIIGTRAIGRTPLILQRFHETGQPQVDISDDSAFDDYPMRRESEISAWVSIMRGCDNHCSYCIVPTTRGPEQSRPTESILDEIRGLANKGYKEITLLGQNVNSYGAGLAPAIDFPGLLNKIEEIGVVERLRFVTSHPKDLSGRLIEAMANIKSLCPSIHLPIQSGSDRILKLMNRGYTSASYFEKLDKLKDRVKDIAVTSDVIVAFPGETDDDFEQTYNAIERAQFANIYLFKYSRRQGTKAAELMGAIDRQVVSERFNRVMDVQKEITRAEHLRWLGATLEILVDGPSKRDIKRYSGRTGQNLVVNFSSDKDYTGQIIHVKITKSRQFSLEGVLLQL